jgi:hypothetical protein
MRKMLLFFIAGFVLGIFILPMIQKSLGFPSSAEVLERVFGEPNAVTIPIVILLTMLFIYLTGRGLFKQAKKEK